MTKRRWISWVCLVLMLGILIGMQPLNWAEAQSSEELELVYQINALRASRGLAAYTVDPALMTMAHEHSVFQASIHESTHLHSDGRGPLQIGVVENVAGGDVGWITPESAIYDIWLGDEGHTKTLLGYATGSIGVGIADDGVTAYYTLELHPGTGSSSGATPGVGNGGTATPYIPIALVPLVTMAPMPDGTIVHVVGYGQTLWAIAMAYGITVDQIRAWNNISPDSDEIYAGQRLLVLPASLVTPHPPAQTETPEPTSSDSVVVVAAVEPGITTGPTQTRTPTLEKEAQEIASPSVTSTMTAGVIPDNLGERDTIPVMVLFALGAILTGLVLSRLLLLRKTNG